MWLIALCWIAQFELQLEEKPKDREVAATLSALDASVTAGDKIAIDANVKKLKQQGGRNAVERLLKSMEPEKRALAVFGFRMLKVGNAWSDIMIMIADPKPMVRRQVYFYAPVARGVEVSDVKIGLHDFAPEVRMAAISAIVKVAEGKPRQIKVAGEALRARFETEKDPNVRRGIEVGLMSLGLPTTAN